MSFDVVSLFTKVPVSLVLKVAEERLKADDTLSDRTSLDVKNIISLLKMCLDGTYFVFRGTIYQQMFGTAMGSPVSVVVANMVMEDVEERALSMFPTPPRYWKQYVDDILTVLPSDMLDIFLLHLNSIESSTYEVENSEGILPFLDISLKHETDGSICTTIFRKQTHTDRYLDFSSHHPITHKMAVIRTLSSRAEATCSKSVSMQDELIHISTALSKNNYPKHLIQRQLCHRPPNTASKDQ